jgi:polyribonucleotide 5'-hydroxyl-kinase
VIDVDCDNNNNNNNNNNNSSGCLEICYTAESTETTCNVAYVNTHAQLEALRDEAAASGRDGPRVLLCGPQESGKSSVAKILTAYACKLGRSPLFVDLDPNDNSLSVPGTLAVCPLNREALSVECYATTGIPPGTASPMVLWHGATHLSADLLKAQVEAMGRKINARMQTDEWERSSGIIVNTNGWMQEEGFSLLLETIKALQIDIVLVMGHDRLYSMLRSSLLGKAPSGDVDAVVPKLIKLPRSGGVVSRNAAYMRQSRSRAMKRYFYGDVIEPPSQLQPKPSSSNNINNNNNDGTKHARVPQLTPFLLHLPFDNVTIYKFSSMSLAASMLPVAAAQTTEPVQLVPVEITAQLQHALLAVCHPQAVAAYQESGRARDLYEAGVAGFCAVERVLMDSDMLHLLSPCAGSLPSNVLLVGDITWME